MPYNTATLPPKVAVIDGHLRSLQAHKEKLVAAGAEAAEIEEVTRAAGQLSLLRQRL